MRLLMWNKSKQTHANSAKGKNQVDTSSDRLIFYDEHGSTVYDKQTDTWFKDGQHHDPSFPLSFTLDDGRSVNVNKEGGKHVWRVQ